MKSDLLRASQLDQALASWRDVNPFAPPGGWLRTLREALGLTTRQAARRAGLRQSTWVDAERREASGTISTGQLRRLGDALGWRLAYALVPTVPLSVQIDAKAEAIAKSEVLSVAHSMALEAQRAEDPFTLAQIAERKHEILRGRRSKLWD